VLDTAILIQIALQIGVPILGAWLLVRRYGRPGNDNLRVFAAGMVAFAAAQATLVAASQGIALLHLPSVPAEWGGLANAAAFGLSIGVLEELANYLVLRFWLRDVRSWAQGLMLGIGHGGGESVFTGIVTAMWWGTMTSLRSGPPPGQTVTDAEKASIDQMLAQYFGTPWHVPIAAGVQQVLLLVIAAGLASLVMRAFLTRRIVYLPAAMGLHALATGSTIYAGQFGILYSLVTAGVFAALAMGIVLRLARAESGIGAPGGVERLPTAAEANRVATADDAPGAPKAARPRKKRARKALSPSHHADN
jgi:uncharacterized membrane protein YhfC